MSLSSRERIMIVVVGLLIGAVGALAITVADLYQLVVRSQATTDQALEGWERAIAERCPSSPWNPKGESEL